ncbi:MAG: endonuclease III [Spirochaetales bacterium]|nr:endonuclease III [Spirochaetales bacterium]
MKIIKIYNILNDLEKKRIIFLKTENNFQLLIGVILSAQTTDRQVNEILPALFRRYPSPEDLASAQKDDVIEIIRSTGFFNIKAGNIIKTAGIINEKYGGMVPEPMEDLLKLAGVGRKTANVIRGACFGLPVIIVDTHFSRTARRLNLTAEKNPDRIEHDLAAQLPLDIQYKFSMLLNKFGRDFCKALKPLCGSCPVERFCTWKFKDLSRFS